MERLSLYWALLCTGYLFMTINTDSWNLLVNHWNNIMAIFVYDILSFLGELLAYCPGETIVKKLMFGLLFIKPMVNCS